VESEENVELCGIDSAVLEREKEDEEDEVRLREVNRRKMLLCSNSPSMRNRTRMRMRTGGGCWAMTRLIRMRCGAKPRYQHM
jgi:hypothetical protein